MTSVQADPAKMIVKGARTEETSYPIPKTDAVSVVRFLLEHQDSATLFGKTDRGVQSPCSSPGSESSQWNKYKN